MYRRAKLLRDQILSLDRYVYLYSKLKYLILHLSVELEVKINRVFDEYRGEKSNIKAVCSMFLFRQKE